MSKYNYRTDIPTELRMFIFYNHGSYAVKNDRNMVMLTFGRFRTLDVACAAAWLLIKYDWNIRKVEEDSIYKFNNKFYVFKVINNQLIFDSIFDSFERAVEHFEINFRCNDYHNDIFKSSINKKNDYKNRYVESEYEEETETDTNYIFQRDNKFIIKKSKMKNSTVFGEFNSLKEAKAARKMLIDSNWRLSDGNEITFFDNNYWVFDIDGGVINYLGKSTSYEDTFDIINPSTVEKSKNNLDLRIEEYYKRKRKQKKKVKKSTPKRYGQKSSIKRAAKKRVSPRDVKIWKPLKKDNLRDAHYNFIIMHSTKKVDKLVAIFDFDISGNNIVCAIDGVEIPWKMRFDSSLDLFPEFELFINIFETNNFDIFKIHQSSSIYYFNDLYYKIKVINGDSIVFNTFESYAKAERNKLVYKRTPIDDSCPTYIDKVRSSYELVKIKGQSVLKVHPLKSLEKIKAVHDILVHLNWDINELKSYDLFYLNGLYWELEYVNHEIFLVNKYESV